MLNFIMGIFVGAIGMFFIIGILRSGVIDDLYRENWRLKQELKQKTT